MVRIVNEAKGPMRVDLLGPMLYAGIVTVDDGRTMKTFRPDDQLISVQASPQRFQPKPAERAKLIASNYQLVMDAGPEVAGRETYRIRLTPRAAAPRGGPRLATRTMLFDKETFLNLRAESREPSQQTRVLTDTLDLRVGLSRPRPSFSLPSGVRTETVWGPVDLAARGAPVAALGFEPRIPKALPYGFQIESKHLLGSPTRPFLGVRITDGLYGATVYQWSPTVHPDRNPTRINAILKDAENVQFTIAGETPDSLARTLLAFFVLRRS